MPPPPGPNRLDLARLGGRHGMSATPRFADEALLLRLAAELTQRGLELLGVLDHDLHRNTSPPREAIPKLLLRGISTREDREIKRRPGALSPGFDDPEQGGAQEDDPDRREDAADHREDHPE